jgi:3-hydroxybutyryl-CoA dehydrogenase
MADLKTIGVIGAGQMGAGIAQVLATAGFTVRLNDVEPARTEKGIANIRAGLERLASKGKVEDVAGIMKRIASASDVAELTDCDLVVEAAAEDETIKRSVYAALKDKLKPDAFLASNTSSLSITRLAASTDRPDRFIGLHFMNPAPVMKLIEVIRGIQTSDETFAMAQGLVDTLGKQAAVSEDYPAFIVNRILMPMINEACYALYEGVGTVSSIDMAMKLGANHPMGPLELADFIGLDTCLSIMRVLHDELADTKYRPCPLLVKYVEAGWLGRKTGRGFYDYRGETPVPTR